MDATKVARYFITQYIVKQGSVDGQGESAIKRVRFSRCSALPLPVARFLDDLEKFISRELFPLFRDRGFYKLVSNVGAALIIEVYIIEDASGLFRMELGKN